MTRPTILEIRRDCYEFGVSENELEYYNALVSRTNEKEQYIKQFVTDDEYVSRRNKRIGEILSKKVWVIDAINPTNPDAYELYGCIVVWERNEDEMELCLGINLENLTKYKLQNKIGEIVMLMNVQLILLATKLGKRIIGYAHESRDKYMIDKLAMNSMIVDLEPTEVFDRAICDPMMATNPESYVKIIANPLV